MLRERRQFLASLLFLFDLGVVCAAWFGAYFLRFSGWPVPVLHGVPPLGGYLIPLLFVPPVWAVAFRAMDLHRPRLLGGRLREALDVVKATALATLCLMSAGQFAVKLDISRLFVVYFALFCGGGILLARYTFRYFLQLRRRNGDRLRRVLIIGSGEVAQQVKQQLDRNPEIGLDVKGYLTRDATRIGQSLDGAPVLGHIDELASILGGQRIDLVFIAIPNDALNDLEGLLATLGRETVEIKIVPDLFKYAMLRGSVEEFEGLPVLSLNNSPLVGWGAVTKRVFDIAVGVPLLFVTLPLQILVALLILLTSGRPIFYRQERMGLDGQTFELLKFRTMSVDAERTGGPVWARKDDPRRTRIGAILRRTSIDELPQLLNVIRGEMSLVGPRPERPVFIEQFRDSFPRYMLRHRVKAGITGWAQVNGWRGNTSVQRRLDHDLHYIQNWSLRFDLKILCLTLLRGLIDRNAY